MDVFRNIFLTVSSLLYLSVVSDTGCPCFLVGTGVLDMLLLGHNATCSMDPRSRKIAKRQICPTRAQVNFDSKRTPRYLIEMKCCNKDCPGGHGYRCEEYKVKIGVIYHEINTKGQKIMRPETIPLSVTCLCVAPRKLPEPPKK